MSEKNDLTISLKATRYQTRAATDDMRKGMQIAVSWSP